MKLEATATPVFFSTPLFFVCRVFALKRYSNHGQNRTIAGGMIQPSRQSTAGSARNGMTFARPAILWYQFQSNRPIIFSVI